MGRDQSLAIRLLEHLVTPTFVIDLQGRVIVWNRACERLTGISSDAVLGTSDHWRAFYSRKRETLVDLVLSGEDKKLKKLYANHLISKGKVRHTIHAENWATMPVLGVKKYLAIDAGPVFNENGELEAAVETIQDLTELKNIQNSLTELATSDSLTGLGNRRFFDGQLHTYWYNARRRRERISLLLIDVDYFKKYNDIYGHQSGDKALTLVGSSLLSSLMRGADQCFRYGGEEFAILLPSTDSAGALDVAERVRINIFDEHFEHQGSPKFKRLTVSVGIATIRPDATNDPVDLIKQADEALYASKAAGRNHTTVHAESLES